MGTLAPRRRKCRRSRGAALCGFASALIAMSGGPRSVKTKEDQSPAIDSNLRAAHSEYLRRVSSAADGRDREHISFNFERLDDRPLPPVSSVHGGARRSQGAGAEAVTTPWPARQALAEDAAGGSTTR